MWWLCPFCFVSGPWVPVAVQFQSVAGALHYLYTIVKLKRSAETNRINIWNLAGLSMDGI